MSTSGNELGAMLRDGLRAAFNDFAGTNVTAGKVEPLHPDVMQAESIDVATRLATIERRLDALETARPAEMRGMR